MPSGSLRPFGPGRAFVQPGARSAECLLRGSRAERRWISAGAAETLGFVLKQSVCERIAHEFSAAAEPELLHHVGAVSLGGADRDEQSLGDLLICVAASEQAQDLALTLGKRIGLGATVRFAFGGDEAGAEFGVDVAAARGN